MKKILFLFKLRDSLILYNIFSKYEKKNVEEFVSKNGYSYFDGNSFIKNINAEWSLFYKNNLIDIKLYHDNDLSENYSEYDDVIVFDTKYLFEKSDIDNFKFKTIFLAIDEIPQPINHIKMLIDSGIKFISSGNTKITNNLSYGYFYSYKLAILFYYYRLGFYHLNLDNIDVVKQNILGFYHKSNYKKNRDSYITQITNLFKNKNNNYIKNYSIPYNDYTTLLDLKYDHGWTKNHITSYTDYIKSICILIFETDVAVNEYHTTEKTLKAILFSKLNIPSILVCNYKQLIELVNDGYWFLNCEFIDFNLLMNSNEVKGRRILNKSVEDSVNFLLEIFELNSKDLNKTNEYIRDKFSYKMQNNYKIFNETIYDIKIQDEIMDFILEPSHSKII
jgi:hypothetical protein